MSSFLQQINYVIIQGESNNQNNIATLLLSIKIHDPTSRIILVVPEETKNHITDMPIDLLSNLEFYDVDNYDSSVGTLYYNMYQCLKYVVETYGECLLVDENAIMVNRVEISEQIREQGYGYMNHYFNGHLPEANLHSYSFGLLYLNKTEFLENLRELILEDINYDIVTKVLYEDLDEEGEESPQPDEEEGEESPQPDEEEGEESPQPDEEEGEESPQPDEEEGEESPQPDEEEGEESPQPDEEEGEESPQQEEILPFKPAHKITVRDHIEIPTLYFKLYNTSHFLNKQLLIRTEDFFGLNNTLEIKSIDTNELTVSDDKRISFILCRIKKFDVHSLNMNKWLYSTLASRDYRYISILALRNMDPQLMFFVPVKEGIGIWSREAMPSGLLDIIDYGIKKYPKFLNKKEAMSNYYSVSNIILYDRPSYEWIHDSFYKFTQILTCNYDEKYLEHIKHVKLPEKFMFYFPDYPNEVLKFRTDNDIVKNKRSDEKLSVGKIIKNNKLRYPATGRRGMKYKTLLKLVHQHKYAHMKTYDMGLFMTLISIGTVPVLRTKSDKLILHNLTEGEHYFVGKVPEKVNYNKLRKNLLKFYDEYLDYDKCINRLLSHLLIGDVE